MWRPHHLAFLMRDGERRKEKENAWCVGDASMSAHIKLFSNKQKDFSGTVRKEKEWGRNSVVLLEQEAGMELV